MEILPIEETEITPLILAEKCKENHSAEEKTFVNS